MCAAGHPNADRIQARQKVPRKDNKRAALWYWCGKSRDKSLPESLFAIRPPTNSHPVVLLPLRAINSMALIFSPTLVEKLLVYVNITLKALMLDSPVTLIE